VLVIRVYQWTLSPLLGGQCRFYPTCSQYAIEAYRLHRPLRATALVVGRLARCQPFARGGYDPVPIPAGHSRQGTTNPMGSSDGGGADARCSSDG